MIRIQLFQGLPIICKSISADPLHSYFFLCQMPDGDIVEVYHSNIRHVGLV